MNGPLLTDSLLRVENLRVGFGKHEVLRGVNIELAAGETVGLVGESGSGKSTLARAILRLLPQAQGSVYFLGTELLSCSAAILRARRRELQIVFQDPLGSLDPRMTVGRAIGEPLQIAGSALGAEAARSMNAMLERVGLGAAMSGRYPRELSGGQCQRVAIARAMILAPKLLICDEAVSSLDVSIQGQIVNLLLDLQRDAGMAMLFISHNLAVVRHLSSRVLVMYLGKLVETARSEELFGAPIHPYSRALLAAVPSVRTAASASTAAGLAAPTAKEPAAPVPPARLLAVGCAFRDRCPYVLAVCAAVDPPLLEVAPGHWAACHRSHEALIPLSLAT